MTSPKRNWRDYLPTMVLALVGFVFIDNNRRQEKEHLLFLQTLRDIRGDVSTNRTAIHDNKIDLTRIEANL